MAHPVRYKYKESTPMHRNLEFTLLALMFAAVLASLPAAAQTHNFWTSGASLPNAVQYSTAGVINGLIYVVGGYDGSAAVTYNQIYNPLANSWSSGAPLPVATCFGAAAVVKGILYIIGGYDCASGGATNAVWAYNPKTNSWSSKAAMPIARGSIGAAVENNVIYVVGGNGNNGNFRLTTVEAFNPATNSWTEEAPLLVGKSEPSVGLLKRSVNGVIIQTIVAADGYTLSGDTGDNEGYSASVNTWSSLTTDPHPRNEACTGALGAKLFVATGSPDGGSTTTESDVFNIAKNAWTSRAPAPQAVAGAGSATYKGLLYCFGGGNGTSVGDSVFNYLQIYHP
jgi:N-acetylneuraminic acid mutarotase